MGSRTRRRPRLYAHRGSNALLPENSLAAFERALSDGANALELDTHRTADGHFVAIHDPNGRRTAGVDQRIDTANLADIKRWRLNSTAGKDNGGGTVPTLEEVLVAFPGIPLSIDIKSKDPGHVPALLELLTKHGGEDRVTLASFHDAQIFRVRRQEWKGRTALSRLEIVWLLASPMTSLCRIVGGHAAQIPRLKGPVRLDSRRLLQRCRQLGLRSDFWVVNDAAEARELYLRGATGVMTDDPSIIHPAIADLLNGNGRP